MGAERGDISISRKKLTMFTSVQYFVTTDNRVFYTH